MDSDITPLAVTTPLPPGRAALALRRYLKQINEMK